MLCDIEQHGSIAANVLHQQADCSSGIHVFLSVLIVPGCDAGFGLEWIGHDLRFYECLRALDKGAINIGKQFGSVLEAVIAPAHPFEIDDNVHCPVIPFQRFVVVVCDKRRSEKSKPHGHTQIHL